MFAQDTTKWSWLQEYIPTIIVNSAGGICPFQADGLLQGLPFYFRERGGSASLRIGEKDGSPFGEGVIYSASVDSDGVNSDELFVALMLTLVPMLKPAPFLWRFDAKKINYVGNDWEYTVSDTEKEDVLGWGQTAAEGLANASSPSVYLESHGCTPEMQKQIWLDMEVNPKAKNSDTRVWPEVTPIFEVKP